jgi:hypothetical protein
VKPRSNESAKADGLPLLLPGAAITIDAGSSRLAAANATAILPLLKLPRFMLESLLPVLRI